MRRLKALFLLMVTSLLMVGNAHSAVVNDDDMVMGNPKAKITVVEYASASCSHCAAFAIDVFPAFKAKYIDTGQVKYVFREVLTEPVQRAAAGFILARCTGKQNSITAQRAGRSAARVERCRLEERNGGIPPSWRGAVVKRRQPVGEGRSLQRRRAALLREYRRLGRLVVRYLGKLP